MTLPINNSNYTQPHLTDAIVMVRPLDFGYNEQTGQDNEFQNRPAQSSAEVTKAALCEFSTMVNRLTNHHLTVSVLEKPPATPSLPDAIFPNNWFSTRADGTLFIYPMKTKNRQAEVQVEALQALFSRHGYHIKRTVDLRATTPADIALEGTGSIIFHHPSGHIFAALSERCDEQAVKDYAQDHQYQLSTVETLSEQGNPVYHTNVLMACGSDFAVVVDSVLCPDIQRQEFLYQLQSRVSDVITITETQMSQHFCGNIIQLKDRNNEPCIVMSGSAYKGFTVAQKKNLEKHGELVVCEIPTIEHIGGGSARCMIAENFLPKHN